MTSGGQVARKSLSLQKAWFLTKGRLRSLGIVIGLIIMILFLALKSEAFLKPANLLNILRQSSVVGIMAVGMTFVLIVGGFDLSVGSAMGLAGGLAVGLLPKIGLGPSLLVALLMGIVAGMVNGLLVVKLNVNAFVATLGIMNILRGILLMYSGGKTMFSPDRSFALIGSGYLGPIPIPVVIFTVVTLCSAFILHRTRFGRYIYAVGGNEEASIFSGIDAGFYKAASFAIVGLLAALSGVVLASRLQSVAPMAGSGYELDAIAAAVIGGTSISGGQGSIWQTVAGVFVLGVINNGFNILNVNEYIQLVFKGAIVVAAVALDTYSKRKT